MATRLRPSLGCTVMETGADCAVIPVLSVATAVSTYGPSAILLHVAKNGSAVALPMDAPFAKNSTFTTFPSGSDAVALKIIVVPAGKLSSFAGLVICTSGGRRVVASSLTILTVA